MARTNRPKTMIKVGAVGKVVTQGAYIYAPSSFSEAPEDIWQEDTGRDLDGVLHGKIVNKVRKWEASWNALSESEARTLINTIMEARASSDGFFDIAVSSFEPTSPHATGTVGNLAVYTVYLGERTYSYEWWENNHKYVDFSCSFIEKGKKQ